MIGHEPVRRRVTHPFPREDTEQYHVCVGGLGIAREDDRRFALRILKASSADDLAPVQEIREQRAAYSVFLFSNMYAGCGEVGLAVGTRPENLTRPLRVLAEGSEEAAGPFRAGDRALART